MYVFSIQTAQLKYFKTNAANSHGFIDVEFQNRNIVIGALTAQNASTVSAVLKKELNSINHEFSLLN